MNILEREVLIWLNSLGISNRNIQKIIDNFPSLIDFWEIDESRIASIDFLKKESIDMILKHRKLDNIKKLINNIEKENLSYLTIYDENYPIRLRHIDDNPLVLYQKGNELKEDTVTIGIVGSRKATSYGKWACEKFTKELVNMGVTIVSGLASGIDAIAHKTALDNNGYTIGILGNGIDIVYPKRNLSIFKEMEREGTILSEFPIGTEPLPYNFPQRNRIISGLSLGVIVIEAQEKSGSLITAHHALDQGKDVFALPGNINSIFSGGTNKLIKDGAKPLLSIDDIIEEIYELQQTARETKITKIDYSDLSDTEAKIVKVLEEGPTHADTIVYKLGLNISAVNSALTILELKGMVGELQGRIFTIK